ncbi:MAG: hypothetical protein ACRCT6_11745 [Notoacmeibacter sp.]
MLKAIHQQLYKMTFVLFLLFALGFWAREFTMHAIGVAIFLNATIFGSFFFGVFVAYRNVFVLKNEILAFEALKEDYEDITKKTEQDNADPYWRYYRCESPAVIFKPPHILEQPYQIISEEIARTRGLSMSTGEMQNLLDTVHEEIHSQRSLVTFVTGLQIMLGLLGTFVGLMETLSSVGAIISGLDLSGAGGTAAIQGLMEDLGVPLQGMATGFSSSLFGLITSLTLGILARFSNQASDLLKSNFATWLAGVAKVDSSGANNGPAGATGASGFSADAERMVSLMYRVAKISLVSNAKVVTTVERLGENALLMVNAQAAADEATLRLGRTVEALSENQTRTTDAILRIADSLETREEMRGMLGDLRHSAVAFHQKSHEMNKSLNLVAQNIVDMKARAAEKDETLATREDLSRLLTKAQTQVAQELSNLHGSVESLQTIMADIERSSGANAMAAQESRMSLTEMRRDLKDDLEEAIASSRAAIERADALAKQRNALSVGALQQVLVDHFTQLAEDTEVQQRKDRLDQKTETLRNLNTHTEKQDAKSRKFFGLFNRRAG